MRHNDETTNERVASAMHSLRVAFWGDASDASAATRMYRYSLVSAIVFAITISVV